MGLQNIAFITIMMQTHQMLLHRLGPIASQTLADDLTRVSLRLAAPYNLLNYAGIRQFLNVIRCLNVEMKSNQGLIFVV